MSLAVALPSTAMAEPRGAVAGGVSGYGVLTATLWAAHLGRVTCLKCIPAQYVLVVSDDFEMLWIKAVPMLTAALLDVVYCHPGRDRPDQFLVADPMHESPATIDGNPTVALMIVMSRPEPASTFLIEHDTGEESFD